MEWPGLGPGSVPSSPLLGPACVRPGPTATQDHSSPFLEPTPLPFYFPSPFWFVWLHSKNGSLSPSLPPLCGCSWNQPLFPSTSLSPLVCMAAQQERVDKTPPVRLYVKLILSSSLSSPPSLPLTGSSLPSPSLLSLPPLPLPPPHPPPPPLAGRLAGGRRPCSAGPC